MVQHQPLFRSRLLIGAVLVLVVSSIYAYVTWFSLGPGDPIEIESGISSVVLSPNGSLLAVSSGNGGAEIWSVAERHYMYTIGSPTAPHAMAWSPDSRFLARWGDHGIEVLRVADGVRIATLEAHTAQVWDISWSYDSAYIASADRGETAYLWHMGDGGAQLLQTLPISAIQVAFSPTENLLALGGRKDAVLWDVEQAKSIAQLTAITGSSNPTFSTDGRFLAVSGGSDDVHIVRVQDWTLVRTITGYTDSITVLAFSPDNTLIAVGGGDTGSGAQPSPVKVWRIADGQLLHTFDGHRAGLRGLGFLPDGKTIVSGSADTTIRFWVLP